MVRKVVLLISFLVIVIFGIVHKVTQVNFDNAIQINNIPVIVDEVQISQNIPIPQEILNAQIEKRKAEKLEQERLIAEQKALEEQKRQEELNKIKSSKITSRNLETPRQNGWISFTATAYCGCYKCTGNGNNLTASGKKATANHTVAMPKSYAFGTQIEIKGMGTYTVEDRGGAIKGNRIDIYFNSHQEALNFGRRTVYLRVID